MSQASIAYSQYASSRPAAIAHSVSAGEPRDRTPPDDRHQPLDQAGVGADLGRVDRLRLRDHERPVKPGDGGDPQRRAVQRRAAARPAANSSSCSGS